MCKLCDKIRNQKSLSVILTLSIPVLPCWPHLLFYDLVDPIYSNMTLLTPSIPIWPYWSHLPRVTLLTPFTPKWPYWPHLPPCDLCDPIYSFMTLFTPSITKWPFDLIYCPYWACGEELHDPSRRIGELRGVGGREGGNCHVNSCRVTTQNVASGNHNSKSLHARNARENQSGQRCIC